jgi:hypothetical protein|tara:strand:- start:1270 stop:1509 length:240 start_codon:yes stop_codon:yes gene_type:complete
MNGNNTQIIWSGTKEMAESLMLSIGPDDPESFEMEIIQEEDVSKLIISIKSENLSTVRYTVDDILSCLSAVEASFEKIK